MDVITEIDRLNRLRKHKIYGHITFDRLKTYLFELYEHPGFDNSLHSLWDLSQADGISDLSTDEVRSLVLLVSSKWNSEVRVRAALVVSRELEFGVARMYEIQLSASSENKIKVFKDVEDAIDWVVE